MIASCDSEGEFGFENDAANAAFIVRAANSHDALVEALKVARIYVFQQVRDDGGIDACDISYRIDLENIDVALKLAEVGQ